MTSGDLAEALARAQAHAPFLAQAMRRNPDLAEMLHAGDIDAALVLARGAGEGAENVAQQLRREKLAMALLVAVADLSGLWSLEQVTGALSDFADRACHLAIAAALAERDRAVEDGGIALIALGKHGSHELNYSSDIDPILLFDPDRMPLRRDEEPQEAAVRIARRAVALLSERDADGYVFRVDLRLRPSPEVSPIILPVNAAISYYESSALGWEQAAFIRARAAAGDLALGDDFLRAIRPFVWRRSLDFGQVAAITGISQRIRGHYAQGQAFGPGYDLKRGRGGIREVEFHAQIHQLIHGGRNPALRAPATRAALSALAQAGMIDAEVAAQLDAAYVLLRTVEHRLQMVDDLQTHELPRDAAALDNVAALHGLPDGAALLGLLQPHVGAVVAAYDRLSGDEDADAETAALPVEQEDLEARLHALGFSETTGPLARIARWRDGSMRALRHAPAREALEEILPALLAAVAQGPDPAAALNRIDDLIAGLPSAINFFRLLAARPGLMQLLVEVTIHAPVLAELLGRRVALFDTLVDASALEPPPDAATLAADFAAIEPGEDYQALLDRVRARVGDRRFALGVQLVHGATDPMEVGAGYGRVAQAAIETLTAATVAEFESAHGRVPDSELLLLALGRLGGGVLTHASDLDLVYLFTGDFSAESDGPRPLGATQYYNRLAQRGTAALSVATASGPLYEVDTRLRPSGAQGLLCVSLDSFARYQREAAWSWEHLALTRARPIFGSAQGRAALSQVLDEILRAPRDSGQLLRDAVKMRADIATHKPPAGPLDVKLAAGGLVDCEFLVQCNQYCHADAFTPVLEDALAQLIAHGHIPPDVGPAQALLTRYLIVSRLVAPDGKEPAQASRALVARACGADDWNILVERMDAARHIIADAWAALSGSARP